MNLEATVPTDFEYKLLVQPGGVNPNKYNFITYFGDYFMLSWVTTHLGDYWRGFAAFETESGTY